MKRKTALIKNWKAWVAVGLVISVPLALYFYTFALNAPFTLSRDEQSWADFGSFTSGTVGSLLSFLAFTGLIYSIHNQQNQHSLDSILNHIFDIGSAIDTSLSKSIKPLPHDDSTQFDMSLSYALVILSSGNSAREKHPNSLTDDDKKSISAADYISTTAKAELMEVGANLNLLVNAWTIYLDQGGAPSIINLQKMKYWNLALLLHKSGINFRSVNKTFDMKKIKSMNDEGKDYEAIWDAVCD
ncbi:hypothetical protein ACTG2C_03660 [Aeromonas veronii]